MLALPLLHILARRGILFCRADLSPAGCIGNVASGIPEMDIFKDVSFKLSLIKPAEKHFDLFYLKRKVLSLSIVHLSIN